MALTPFAGVIPSENTVLVEGKANPAVSFQLEGSDNTNFKPRRLVSRGSNDSQIVLCQKNLVPRGVLGFEQAHGENFPAEIDDSYALGAWAPVLNGPGTVMMLEGETALTKDDVVTPGDDGKVRKLYPGNIKTMVIPFTKNTSELDTGYDLPEGAVVLDAFVDVETNVAGATIDVGILSSEVGGDADGFLNGVSCETAGKIAPVTSADAAEGLTKGALLGTPHKSADASALFGVIPKLWIGDGTATSISYTTSDHDVEGNIYVLFTEPGATDTPVGRVEITTTGAGAVPVRMWI